jgi:hypothetical protein
MSEADERDGKYFQENPWPIKEPPRADGGLLALDRCYFQQPTTCLERVAPNIVPIAPYADRLKRVL